MSDATPRIELTGAQFDALLAGEGDVDALDVLRRGQYNKWLRAFGSILQALGDDEPKAAVDLLDEALQASPEAFFDLATYPHVGMWADSCLRQLLGFGAAPSASSDVGHLSVLAVAAACRADIRDFQIEVPVVGGAVVIPSFGRLRLDGTSASKVTIVREQGSLRLLDGDRVLPFPDDLGTDVPSSAWEPLRRLRAEADGLVLDVVLDDIDPYRYHYIGMAPPSERLSSEELEAWAERVQDGWALLVRHSRSFAEGVATGLRVVVPLQWTDYNIAETSRAGFGAIAMSLPSDEHWLVGHLLSEFQATKISAVSDLVPLHAAVGAERVHYLPWLRAPRSFEEALHGFAGWAPLLRFWGHRAEVDDAAGARSAQIEAVMRQSNLNHVAGMLTRSGDLTDWGHRLVSGIERKVRSRSSDIVVDDGLLELARNIQADNYFAWRLRNVEVDYAASVRLADAWSATVVRPSVSTIPVHVRDGDGVVGHQRRKLLAIWRDVDPDRFARWLEEGSMEVRSSLVQPSDIAVAEGRSNDAMVLATTGVRADPKDPEPWSTLAVASWTRDVVGVDMLLAYPEVPYAVNQQVFRRTGRSADPMSLVRWLQPLVPLVDDPVRWA